VNPSSAIHGAPISSTVENVCQDLSSVGFSTTRAAATLQLLGVGHVTMLLDWHGFRDSWSNLPLDTFMSDDGRYRRRRHSTLSIRQPSGTPQREPDQPHFQELSYNQLNGGIERYFEPIDEAVLTGTTMIALLTLGGEIATRLMPGHDWHIEAHQFRIEAEHGQGLPTPEGRHRDGVDFAMMVMIQRTNIVGGQTTISDLDGNTLAKVSLQDPLDMAIVDDHRVYHEVSPVERRDSGDASHRDVLVATYRRRPHFAPE
jgi:hypothetical protein